MNSNRPYSPRGGQYRGERKESSYTQGFRSRTGVFIAPNTPGAISDSKTADAGRTTPSRTRSPHPGTGSKTMPAGRRMSRKPSDSRGGRSRTPRFNDRPIMVASKNTTPNPILPPTGDNLRIVPLGGVEEIGRNMTAIEYKGDIIVIDAGIQFSDDETPGVDYILPNIKYLEDRKDNIRGVFITHGHLDHIGGIPYIMPRIGNPPLYSREFGALFIQKRQEEFTHLPPLDVRMVKKGDAPIRIGEHLTVDFFGLTHSIPDSSGVIIGTPFGDIITTGDVRVENKDGVVAEAEIKQYADFKKRNVLLLMMDSTGIDKAGWTISESQVVKNIDEIVGKLGGRVVIATFASQVERIIEFIKIAAKYGKKVVMEGRAMKTNAAIVKQLDLVDLSNVIAVEDMEQYPPHKIMIIATGAQGEEFAALMRISNQTHKNVRLNDTDTIILSSSVIPGNERAVTKLKDNLYRHNARIITYLDSDVHASGHGKRSELEWIHRQIPYRFFMPVHGYHFMLKMHAELARSLGAEEKNIVVPDNSSLVEISADLNGKAANGSKELFESTRIGVRAERAPHEDMIVEGFRIGDAQEVVIRDRQTLAQDGMFVLIASINVATGKLKKSPDIISRGFVYLRESQDLLQQARWIIKKTIEDATNGMNPINFDYVKQAVTDAVAKFLLQQTAKRPIVIPVILGV